MEVQNIEKPRIQEYDFNNLEFGKVFSDFMLVSDYVDGQWTDHKISKLEPILMHPGTSVLHYGQSIFEGLKAYNLGDGRINAFRLQDNLHRLNKSAERMAMPQFDVNSLSKGIQELIACQKEWVPTREQGSLYIRPLMYSTDATLRAVPSKNYKLLVMCSPVGFYYSKPISVRLERKYARAAKGGIGYAKAAGNYAGSFMPSNLAKEAGYDQVLWTDISNNYTLEELGSANVFFVKNGELYTPKSGESILRGITRDTIVKIARSKGVVVHETDLPAEEFKNDLAQGNIQCVFATGTAAAITYINKIDIDGDVYDVPVGYELVKEFGVMLDQYKFAELSDEHNWYNIV